MKNLFEYTDILHSPIEAFTCVTGSFQLPVEAHWHYFMEVIYMQEGGKFSRISSFPSNTASPAKTAGTFPSS